VRASAHAEVPGRIADAEALWYDPRRWPAWVDGFGHLARLDAGWPARGARRTWDGRAARGPGRGRVAEEVLEHEDRTGQRLEVEDARLRGELQIAFAPGAGAAGAPTTAITLTLDFHLKRRHPLVALEEALVERRRQEAALRRTLARFAAEREGDVALSG
jgi:hypothetical protein